MQYGLSDQFADELPFIREILFDVDDEGPRWVYADWLEERGDSRGEFLRLDMQVYQEDLATSQLTEISRRRTELVAQIDPQWMMLLAQAPIESCQQKAEFKFLCPQRWRNLRPFDDEGKVRYCDQCGKSVTYCYTIEEAREQAAGGQCVAIDPSVPRSTKDLYSPYWATNYSDYGQELLGLIVDE